LLDRRGVKFNAKFALALLPYILLGSALRVLEDMDLLQGSWSPLEAGYYFVTPGIYLFIAVVAIAALLASLFASKKFNVPFHALFAAIGLVPAIPIVLFEMLNFRAWLGVAEALLFAFAAVALLIFAIKRLKRKILESGMNRLAIASQALDGFATLVATGAISVPGAQFFSCGEQHPLSGFLLDFFPISFVIAKLGLVLLILYYVDREIKNENLRGFIKLVVIVLGFATGLRDLLTLGVGTCL
jgi:uncharacterized membrane protein